MRSSQMTAQILVGIALLGVAAFLSACGAPGSQPTPSTPTQDVTPPSPSVTTPAESPAATVVGPIVGTSVPGGSVVSPPLRDITPGPLPTEIVLTPGPDGVVLLKTQERAGQVIMSVGQLLKLELEDFYDWAISVQDQALLTPESDALSYRASRAGTTSIELQGEPKCRNDRPACMAPSVAYTVAVTIK